MAKQFWSFIISYTTRNAIKVKGAIAELSISDAIREILSFYVPLIVSVVIIMFFPWIRMVLPDPLMK